jgi:hypothetical protein
MATARATRVSAPESAEGDVGPNSDRDSTAQSARREIVVAARGFRGGAFKGAGGLSPGALCCDVADKVDDEDDSDDDDEEAEEEEEVEKSEEEVAYDDGAEKKANGMLSR